MIPGVILIGGAPGAGKTTLGQALAARLGISSLGCDDLVQAAKGVTSAASHPDLHARAPGDGAAYFTDSPVERLISDVMRQHEGSWPAIERVIRARATWGAPVVIDGCALQPRWVKAMQLTNVASVWLDASRELLEARERANDFYAASTDPERMLKNFLGRSHFYNDYIRDEATACGYTVIRQDGTLSAAALCDRVVRALDIQEPLSG